MEPVDPFTVLGVPPGASPDEVAAAYRELAKAWHPDRRGADGEDRMAEINVAYELLRAGALHERRSRPAPGPAPERGKGAGSRRSPCGARSGPSCSRRSRSARMSDW